MTPLAQGDHGQVSTCFLFLGHPPPNGRANGTDRPGLVTLTTVKTHTFPAFCLTPLFPLVCTNMLRYRDITGKMAKPKVGCVSFCFVFEIKFPVAQSGLDLNNQR